MPKNEPLADGNIQLTYRMQINSLTHPDEGYQADGAEVFTDEHGVQWIKFFPRGGIDEGKEHIIRTDQVYIVRES
jgi:hypothetical protein